MFLQIPVAIPAALNDALADMESLIAQPERTEDSPVSR